MGRVAGGPSRPCHTRARHHSDSRRIHPPEDASQPSLRPTSRPPGQARHFRAKLPPEEPAFSSCPLLDAPGHAFPPRHESSSQPPSPCFTLVLWRTAFPTQKAGHHPPSRFLPAQHSTHRQPRTALVRMTSARRHPAGTSSSPSTARGSTPRNRTGPRLWPISSPTRWSCVAPPLQQHWQSSAVLNSCPRRSSSYYRSPRPMSWTPMPARRGSSPLTPRTMGRAQPTEDALPAAP